MQHLVIICLLSTFFICSCSNESDNGDASQYNISITNSMRHGRPHFGTDSAWHSYYNITTTIKNEASVPLTLDLQLENPYRHLNKNFRLYFLPQHMEVEAQRNIDFFNDTVMPYIRSNSAFPSKVHHVLQPGDSFLVNTAYFSPKNSDFGPGQLAIISDQHHFNFASIPDSLSSLSPSNKTILNLALGLNFSILTDSVYGFKLIPIGNISL